MRRNQKLTKLVRGRTVRHARNEAATLIIAFDDGSTMTVKTAGTVTAISTGARVKVVLEDHKQCALQFDDGSSITIPLADPGASVAIRNRDNTVEYLG